jgi:hypothetical protein
LISDGARQQSETRHGSIEVPLGKRCAQSLNHALGIAVLPDIAANRQPDCASFGGSNDIGERLALSRPLWPTEHKNRNNRREAALGLATRCDAAELYESLRLGDPLVATRESFSGTVVSGIVTAASARALIEVSLDYLACRLREVAASEGFLGFPRDVPAANGRGPWLHGRVAATRVTADERLVVTVTDGVVRPGPARIGQRVTLRPRSVDPRQQRSGRQELHRRYAARRS